MTGTVPLKWNLTRRSQRVSRSRECLRRIKRDLQNQFRDLTSALTEIFSEDQREILVIWCLWKHVAGVWTQLLNNGAWGYLSAHFLRRSFFRFVQIQGRKMHGLVGWLIDWLIDWLNDWLKERTNEYMDEWINQWINENMQHRQKDWLADRHTLDRQTDKHTTGRQAHRPLMGWRGELSHWTPVYGHHVGNRFYDLQVLWPERGHVTFNFIPSWLSRQKLD